MHEDAKFVLEKVKKPFTKYYQIFSVRLITKTFGKSIFSTESRFQYRIMRNMICRKVNMIGFPMRIKQFTFFFPVQKTIKKFFYI